MVNKWVHPSELKLVDNAPEPKAADDEIIVDVYSSALNFFDVRCIVSTTSPVVL